MLASASCIIEKALLYARLLKYEKDFHLPDSKHMLHGKTGDRDTDPTAETIVTRTIRRRIRYTAVTRGRRLASSFSSCQAACGPLPFFTQSTPYNYNRIGNSIAFLGKFQSQIFEFIVNPRFSSGGRKRPPPACRAGTSAPRRPHP